MNKKRDRISSIGYVLAAAGSAVGLGNLWKFPTLAGKNGGGIFLLFYLVFVLVLGLPLLLGEAMIGRHAQVGPTDAYTNIAHDCGRKGVALKFWRFIGWSGAAANFIILSYYSVIAGWILRYIFVTFTTDLTSMDMGLFGSLITENVWPIIFAWIIIAITVFINYKGMSGGVEKVAKVLMPALVILLIIAAVCSMTLDGASEGIKFMWGIHYDRAVAAGGLGAVALAAMGQCFFSLSLGTGQMITLSSFMGKDENIIKNTYGIPTIDTGVALLAGFVTLPAVFAVSAQTGIDPTSQTGPGMLMYALPQSLNAAFGPVFGKVVLILILIAVVFAAITSTQAMEVATITYLNEAKKVDYKKSTIWIGIAAAVVAAICSLSNNLLSGFTIGGMVIQDQLDYFISNILMPFATFCMCIFIGYIWKPQNAIDEATNGGKINFWWSTAFKWLMMVIDPALILIVFLSGIGILG